MGLILTDDDPDLRLDPRIWPALFVDLIRVTPKLRVTELVVDVREETPLVWRLLDNTPADGWFLDRAFFDLTGDKMADPSYSIEFRVRGFSAPSCLGPAPAVTDLPILRLTYPADPPKNDQLRDRLGLAGADYLYVTATVALEAARASIAHPRQETDETGVCAVRFDRLMRHLLQPRQVLPTAHQRIYLQRGIRTALQEETVREAVLHDVPAWLDALNQLEQRGEDVTTGFRPELLEELTSPALAPILTALQKGYRAARPAHAAGFEEVVRRFLATDFTPPPLVVLEGFTYLLPLQAHFVQRCLEKGARVVFIHPHDPDQPDAFAVMDRTYSVYAGQAGRDEIVTPFTSAGHDLRLLQRGAFASQPPACPQGDGSVTITAHAHRHREVAACLERVRTYLATPDGEGRKPPAGDIAIVTRNSGEFLTVLQEEARRLGLLDRLRLEPRLLLLTPLGRFALALFDLSPDGRLEVTAEQFETMLASGWLGAAVQQTVEAFAAVRAQVFDRCRTPDQWQAAFCSLEATDQTAPELARLPGTAARQTDVAAWRKAFGQVTQLHRRLFEGPPRSIAEHIRRLRDELAQLNPDDLREDERNLRDQIIHALEEVVGSSALELDAHELGELMAGVARGEHMPEEELDTSKVWVTTPEAIDSAPRAIVFYLGADAVRVPRPTGMPWPFFALNPDADTERERYLFLAVVRAARRELHLSYARQGEDEVYGPSAYLTAAARLLQKEKNLELPAGPPPQARPTALALPVLSGKADEYDLHDVAAFGLCPYRFRLERFDPSARRYRERFQLRFVAQGVWLDRVFARLVGAGTFRDATKVREALHTAARAVRGQVGDLFPALGSIGPQPAASVHWEVVRRALKGEFDKLVDDWFALPNDKGKTPLDYGVTFEAAPPGTDFTVEVDGRPVVVRSGLRHVVRIGQYPRPLPNALTHLHWLLPSYRSEDCPADPCAGKAEGERIEVFADLQQAVRWWGGGKGPDGKWAPGALHAALGKEAFAETYRAFQQQLAERLAAIQAGRFPKHPGDHCELCPVRHTCLGIPET